VLAEVGIRVDSAEARQLFVERGCRVDESHRVFLSHELVSWAVAASPSKVTVYDRSGEKAFTLAAKGEGPTRFGVGVTNLFYQDPESDQVIPFTLKHVETAARLTHTLSHFDLLSTPGVAQDLSPETADGFTTLEMVANTQKPLVLLVSEHRMFAPVLDLIDRLVPGHRERPFAIPYVNPITPLVLNNETSRKMMEAIRRGLPIIFSNYGMSGATTPITSAGTLITLNAELLAGLVFSQLVREGAPVILGSLPAGFDMKSMMSRYTPHTMLLNLACAEMMHYYGIPHAGTSGSGPGWGPDLLADGALWMNHLTSCLGKVGISPFVGGNFDSLAFSPATVVLADEIIRQAKLFTAGFSLDDEAVAFQDIQAIGAGGNFLMSPSTLRAFRDLPYDSSIWPGLTLEQWQKKDHPKAGKMLKDYTASLLNRLEVPEDHDALKAEGLAFLDRLKEAT